MGNVGQDMVLCSSSNIKEYCNETSIVYYDGLFTYDLFTTGCSPKSPVSEGNNGTVEIKLGTLSTYEVAGTSEVAVMDTVSGCSFFFPDGGSGTLSVAPVLSAPALDYPSTKIAVEYSGDENLAIAVPHTEGNEDILFVYTQYPNIAVDDVTVDETWWGIAPSEQRNDATVFSISTFFVAEQAAKRVQTTGTTVVLAFSSISTTSPDGVKMAALRESLKQAVDWWLENLPSALAASARTQVEGDLSYSVTWANDGNSYDHIRHTFGPGAIFELNVNGDPDTRATNHTIAHEVGHYMTHVLVGYDRYVEILDCMPTNWYGRIIDHGFTEYFEFRKYVVEEYAYLSDYLITGSVDNNDLRAPMMSTILGDKGPDEKDFPSFEGFGSVMLGSLLRTDPQVKSFWKKQPLSDAPVVGAPVADVLGIVARGARDTNELRLYIQEYLDSRGNAERFKLPAILEPLGWSYNGNGTVVDKSNKPVKGAHVQSICQDGTNEYRTYTSTATGDDGTFLLPRIYPGTNILRILWNGDKDSTDVSFTADWIQPTNVSLKMGTFVTEDKPVTLTVTRSKDENITSGDLAILKITTTSTLTVSGIGIEISDTGDVIVPLNTPVSAQITATCIKTILNETTPTGGWYTFDEPVFWPKAWSVSEYRFNGIQITKNSTDTIMDFDFTFLDKDHGDGDHGFNMAIYGQVGIYWWYEENDKSVLLTSWTPFWYGPLFHFIPK